MIISNVNLQPLDRPLSLFGPSTFTLWIVHFFHKPFNIEDRLLSDGPFTFCLTVYFPLNRPFSPFEPVEVLKQRGRTYLDDDFSDWSCSSTHKYAYLGGKYCCGTNSEKNDSAVDGDLCDGSEIGIDSRCCENNDYAKCEYERCINHKDAITTDQGNFN